MPQVEIPCAGFIRDRAGVLRPVHGAAGSFVVGKAIVSDVLSAASFGPVGFAKTATELLLLNENGSIVERIPAPAGSAEFVFSPNPAVFFVETGELWDRETRRLEKAARPDPTIRHEQDEVILRDGTRVRLPEPVSGVDWMGDRWIIARGAGALYAVRTVGAEPLVVRLPEPAE